MAISREPEVTFFGIGAEMMECISRKTKFELFDAILRDCPEALALVNSQGKFGEDLYKIFHAWVKETP